MKFEWIVRVFEKCGKVCAVMMAPAIIFSTAATVIVFPLTAFFSLLSGNLRQKFILVLRNPVVWALLVFYAMFLFGAIYSTGSWSDASLVLRKYSKFLLAIMFIPFFVEEKWRNYAINAFLGGIVVLLIASYLRGYGWLQYGAIGPVEVFKPTIEFNFLLAFASYLCLIKITSIRCCRWVWAVFFLLIVHTILFRSMGRSGYFVFMGLMGLFFIQKFKWRGFFAAAIGGVLLLGSAYVFSPTFHDRMQLVFNEVKTYHNEANTSVGLRVQWVANSIKLIKKHPVLGAGTGSYIREYAGVNTNKIDVSRNPHNEYIYIAVQFGILGLLVLLGFFAVPLWYSRFLPEREKYIARGAVLSIMIGCLANSWLLDVTTGHFYAYFIVLAFAALPRKKIVRI